MNDTLKENVFMYVRRGNRVQSTKIKPVIAARNYYNMGLQIMQRIFGILEESDLAPVEHEIFPAHKC